ncbi:MAG: serine/threonine protein kinase [Myxococcales bacterium]|nr:serine/threonine protein kinase [Myxococcales bacterium]
MPSGDPLAVHALIAGKYRVLDRIDDGSMSIVARARVEGPSTIGVGNLVALKVLHPDLAGDPELVERFRREARALGRVRSPHAVRMYEVVEIPPPCMVMEWLEGEDLDHRVAEDGPLPVDEAVRAIVEACDAISEAHALGIIHRDLKPANLFLTPTGVKVIDFGIAKDALTPETSLTGTGAAMGSPLYMAPEQIRCERVDARADVWALGVTLYELLVGVTPFESEVPAMVLAGILGRSAPPIRDDRPDVSERLEAIVFRCLEKDKSGRFASASALAEALEDL